MWPLHAPVKHACQQSGREEFTKQRTQPCPAAALERKQSCTQRHAEPQLVCHNRPSSLVHARLSCVASTGECVRTDLTQVETREKKQTKKHGDEGVGGLERGRSGGRQHAGRPGLQPSAALMRQQAPAGCRMGWFMAGGMAGGRHCTYAAAQPARVLFNRLAVRRAAAAMLGAVLAGAGARRALRLLGPATASAVS